MAQKGGRIIDPSGTAALNVHGVLDTSGVWQPGQINTAMPPSTPLNLADGMLLQAGNAVYPPSIRGGTQGLAFLNAAGVLNAALPPLSVMSANGDWTQGGLPGGANSTQEGVRLTTGVVSDGVTAKTVMNILIPNAAQSLIMMLAMRVGITSERHVYDSTRVGQYTLALTRVPNGQTVASLSAVANPAIATSAGGQTLTFVLAPIAVTGANNALQTLALQITATASVAGTADCQIVFSTLNGAASGVTVQ